MKILDINDKKYIVQRELSKDRDRASTIQKHTGGILIKDSRSGVFFLCQEAEEIEFHEDVKEEVEKADS